MDRIELLLNILCRHIWKHVSPSVGCAGVCQVSRLQILRDLVNHNAKPESLSDSLSSSERELRDRRSQRDCCGVQQPNAKASEGCAGRPEIECVRRVLEVSGSVRLSLNLITRDTNPIIVPISSTPRRIPSIDPHSGPLRRSVKSAKLRMVSKGGIKALEAENPPSHLVMGSDALARTRANIEVLTTNLNNWEAVTKSTDFPDMAKNL